MRTFFPHLGSFLCCFYQDEEKKSAINKKINSQIKKPHLKMIPIKDKYFHPVMFLIKSKTRKKINSTSSNLMDKIKWTEWGDNSSPLFYPLQPFFPVSILIYFIHKIWRSPVNFFSCFLILSKTHNKIEINL